LNAIKEHALNYQETNTSYQSLLTHSNYGSTQDRRKMKVYKITPRFLVAKEVLELYIGGLLIFTKNNQADNDYITCTDPDKWKIQKSKTFEPFLSYLYLQNADQNNYGLLLTGCNTQQSLKNN
jgi:hypothetical protein